MSLLFNFFSFRNWHTLKVIDTHTILSKGASTHAAFLARLTADDIIIRSLHDSGASVYVLSSNMLLS